MNERRVYPLPDDLDQWAESARRRRLADERMAAVFDAVLLAVLFGGAIWLLHYTLTR